MDDVRGSRTSLRWLADNDSNVVTVFWRRGQAMNDRSTVRPGLESPGWHPVPHYT